MKNYDTELLNKTYDRLVNFLEKNSNLTIFIGGDIDDINSDLTEICISRKRSSLLSSSLTFKASLKSTEEDNKYSFLLYHSHKYNDCVNYIRSSIFNVAERCRKYYNKHCVDDNSIAYELYSSEAGRIIKELGFPESLEELTIRMDLMGI